MTRSSIQAVSLPKMSIAVRIILTIADFVKVGFGFTFRHPFVPSSNTRNVSDVGVGHAGVVSAGITMGIHVCTGFVDFYDLVHCAQISYFP